MQRRALLSVVNIGVAVAALLIWFRYPRYWYYALYALFGWFLVSFSLTWTIRPTPAGGLAAPVGVARGAQRGGAPAALSPLPAAGPAPLRGNAPDDARPIPFCVYCATDLPEDAERCPACGRLVPAFA